MATLRCYTQSREIRHCRFHASLVRGSDGEPDTVLLLVEDITEHLATQENIHRLAHHDMLTGLPNRVLFQDRLDQALARGRREGCKGALMLLDLDQFKEINDSLGHAAGDAALIEFSRRLAMATRESDTVARLGGDEFAVLLTHAGSATTLATTLDRIQTAVEGPFAYLDRVLRLRASMGASRCPEDWRDATALMECADMRMYEAKRTRQGRDRTGPVPLDPPC